MAIRPEYGYYPNNFDLEGFCSTNNLQAEKVVRILMISNQLSYHICQILDFHCASAPRVIYNHSTLPAKEESLKVNWVGSVISRLLVLGIRSFAEDVRS